MEPGEEKNKRIGEIKGQKKKECAERKRGRGRGRTLERDTHRTERDRAGERQRGL